MLTDFLKTQDLKPTVLGKMMVKTECRLDAAAFDHCKGYCVTETPVLVSISGKYLFGSFLFVWEDSDYR